MHFLSQRNHSHTRNIIQLEISNEQGERIFLPTKMDWAIGGVLLVQNYLLKIDYNCRIKTKSYYIILNLYLKVAKYTQRT